ncbi:glycosyltransferase family 2 protein [Vagococcus bubulae]|uniref:glycosyltransferase family 2 protein n=1 Tax=Vagococcus bubulae TaxID=1977868 RepID=UPI001403B798|nr:glycosyltransferase family 2 protein [Vagococcus bubulae]
MNLKEKNRTSVVIVTYNPDQSTLNSIKKMLEMDVYLIVVDNGTKNTNKVILQIERMLVGTESKYVKFDTNKGLGTAQNKGIEISKRLGKEYIFFFDQDTIIPDGYIGSMINLFTQYEELYPENKLGILAPNYFDRNTKEYAHYALLTDRGYEDKKFKNELYLEVSFAISSGSLIKIEVINIVGLFREDFFIDQIDTEYCLRMRENGYKVVATSGVLLNHTIGNREKKFFLGLTIKPNHHSEVRKYYIFRNGMYTVRTYGKNYPGLKVLMYKRFIHDILGVCLYETNKKRKLSSMYRGIRDSKKSWVD